MKTAIVHFSGLATDPAGDCCGMRTFWAALAEILGATFIVIAWDDPKARDKFAEVLGTNDFVYTSGHSHGADLLYTLLKRIATTNVLVAVFLDLAPPWKPTAWMGPDWPAPNVAGQTLCFYQRNDLALAGVIVRATDVVNVTTFGLHHSTMCADDRVHTLIKFMVLHQHIMMLRKFYDLVKPPAQNTSTT